MTRLFDGGHEQLFDAECSGMRAAWRRAAEVSAQRARVEQTEVRAPGGRNRIGSRLGAAVATFLLGLHAVPFVFHARDASVPDSGIDRNPATKVSSD